MTTTLDVRAAGIVPIFSKDLKVCREYGEALLEHESRLQFELGDWWLFFKKTFHKETGILAELRESNRRLDEYARVSEAFPRHTGGFSLGRIEGLSWSHHRACAGIKDEQERMAWLEDALRQGWSSNKLEQELAAVSEEEHKPRQLSLRAVGELYDLANQEATSHGLDPAEWLEKGIRYLAEHGSPHLRELEAAA